jgi:hypothetical protein
MPKKGKAKPVDRAEPTIKQAMRTDAQKVSVASSITASMAKSPLWAGSPDVQTAAKAWSAAGTSIGTNAALITDLKNQLSVAEAAQEENRRTYGACKRQVLSTVSIACAGSADNVKGFSLDVVTRVPASLLAAVDGVTTSLGAAPGEAAMAWLLGLARHGFLVQRATDSGNAATYSAPTACTKTKYTFGGLSPSGSTVFVRVAAIDPLAVTGQSPWSAWVAATVR